MVESLSILVLSQLTLAKLWFNSPYDIDISVISWGKRHKEILFDY